MAAKPEQSRKSKKSTQKSGGRFSPDFSFETQHGAPLRLIAGADEVGRGCLAGSVVAAAVVFPAIPPEEFPAWVREVRDSKLLDASVREDLALRIREWSLAWCVAEASVPEIEELNILHASLLAMRRAVEGLRARLGSTVPHVVSHVLIDGNQIPKNLPCPATAIIKGDARSLTIAAASILAKVHRDHLMMEAARTYPDYGFEVHKAYPTPQHLEALARLGVTEIHRRGYAPVKAILERGRAAFEPTSANRG